MGKFVITRAKNGKFMFNLVASNGEVVCTSQMYSALAAARNGIDSVRRNAGAGIEDQTSEGYEKLKYPKWEVYEDKAGEIRFRLAASNGETIAVGEGYKAKAGAMNGIDSVRRNAADAETVEQLD